MKKNSIPDNVVYNPDDGRYDAALKPYATNVGAPVIEVPDSLSWKNQSANAVNRHVQSRMQKIQAQYTALMQEYE